jgi:hypothetical protein
MIPASVTMHVLQARQAALTAFIPHQIEKELEALEAAILNQRCVSLPETIIHQKAFGQNLTTRSKLRQG